MSTVETKDIVSIPLSEILSDVNGVSTTNPSTSNIRMMKEKYSPKTMSLYKAPVYSHSVIIPSTVLRVISVLLVITRSYIRMSVGTSDSTVISPIKTGAHNLNATNASAAPRDDVSPATVHTNTPKNRHFFPCTIKWHNGFVLHWVSIPIDRLS